MAGVWDGEGDGSEVGHNVLREIQFLERTEGPNVWFNESLFRKVLAVGSWQLAVGTPSQ